MDHHPGRVQALEDHSGEVRIPGVEAVHRLAADADDEFWRRCSELDAVMQDAISGSRDSLSYDGDDWRLAFASH